MDTYSFNHTEKKTLTIFWHFLFYFCLNQVTIRLQLTCVYNNYPWWWWHLVRQSIIILNVNTSIFQRQYHRGDVYYYIEYIVNVMSMMNIDRRMDRWIGIRVVERKMDSQYSILIIIWCRLKERKKVNYGMWMIHYTTGSNNNWTNKLNWW